MKSRRFLHLFLVTKHVTLRTHYRILQCRLSVCWDALTAAQLWNPTIPPNLYNWAHTSAHVSSTFSRQWTRLYEVVVHMTEIYNVFSLKSTLSIKPRHPYVSMCVCVCNTNRVAPIIRAEPRFPRPSICRSYSQQSTL